MYLVLSLLENYAIKTPIISLLWFFWPSWSTITKRLHILFCFCFSIVFLEVLGRVIYRGNLFSWAMIWSRHIVGGAIYKSPKIYSLKNYYKSISLLWALAFSYHTTSVASLTTKPVGPCQWIYYALESVFWGSQPPWWLCHFFLGVNQSGPGTSLAADQRSYNALGRLHGP